MPKLVQDARSFYHMIKQNRFYREEEDAGNIEVLEDHFKERKVAADQDNRKGTNRDLYLFFQGAMMGAIISAKQWRHHLEVTNKLHEDAARSKGAN